MIRDYQAIMKTWFLKGNQRIIPTFGNHAGVKLIGSLNYKTGDIYMEEHEKYDAKVFLEFVEKNLEKYPENKIIMILDNAKIHHSNFLKDFLEENKERLEFVFLPPYSPNLNKIEALWRWLKDSVINNCFFHTVKDIHNAIDKFLCWISSIPRIEIINRLCF